MRIICKVYSVTYIVFHLPRPTQVEHNVNQTINLTPALFQ